MLQLDNHRISIYYMNIYMHVYTMNNITYRDRGREIEKRKREYQRQIQRNREEREKEMRERGEEEG